MLDSDEIRLNKRDVVDLAERADNTSMANSRNESQSGGSVVFAGRTSNPRNNSDVRCAFISIPKLTSRRWRPSQSHVLELVGFPGIGRALYHCQSRPIRNNQTHDL
jgi:hypothetical protein